MNKSKFIWQKIDYLSRRLLYHNIRGKFYVSAGLISKDTTHILCGGQVYLFVKIVPM